MKSRVLIVDDSELVLSMLRVALEERGVIVDTALTLQELETKRTEAPPDAIVLDVQMPEAWGDDVASTLRGAYGLTIPILLMSTIAPAELERRAQGAEVGWVSKRDGLGALVQSIEHMLAKAKGAA